jgi:hypothetical protein
MDRFSWWRWKARVRAHPKKWALERWLLMYLHEQRNTDEMALAVMAHLIDNGQYAQVRVQSIWVDGTPQAEFSPKGSRRRKKPQCELADLLVCVRKESPAGLLQSEQAILIQAKVATRYDKLPGGKSTQKERLLFEECDRNQAITLYPGVNRQNPIGAYHLGDGADKRAYGLRDCASFLLMAKEEWSKTEPDIGPLQVGWPLDEKKTQIKPHDSFMNAVFGMSSRSPSMGREVKIGAAALSCEWTKMVNDLRGKYESVTMSGYNGQARVTTSASKMPARYMYFNPYKLFFRLLSRRHHPNSASYRQRQNWLSLNLPHMLPERFLEVLKRYRPANGALDWDNAMLRERVRRFFPWKGIPLWHDIPNSPPTDNVDLSHRNNPHIPMVVVTVRSIEQVERNE